MKRLLTQACSVLVAFATVFTAAASPQAMKKMGRPATPKVSTMSVSQASNARTQAKLDTKLPIKVLRSASAANKPGGLALENAKRSIRRAGVAKPFMAPSYEAANLPVINGASVYDYVTGSQFLAHIPTAEGMSFETIYPNVTIVGMAGFEQDGVWYTAIQESFLGMFVFYYLNAYDMESGEAVFTMETDALPNLIFYSTAVDPVTDTVYAVAYNDAGDDLQLEALNVSTSGISVASVSGAFTQGMYIAIDGDGQMYGVGNDKNLYKINKATAECTLVGPIGIESDYITDCAIDAKSGRMFWTYNTDSEGGIAEINKETGAGTKLYAFPDNNEVASLWVPKPAAEDGAPAAVENLAATFEAGAMSGTVSFTMPATLFDGTAASGDISYDVLQQGSNEFYNNQYHGTAAYGAEVSIPVTLIADGSYTFVVTANNAVGVGPKTKVTVYVGYGVPSAPTVSAEAQGKDVTILWDAVETTVDGGYINPADVTYNVYRKLTPAEIEAGGEVDNLVAFKLPSTQTSYVWTAPETEGMVVYQFEVEAVSKGHIGAPGLSNTVVVGDALVPAWSEPFDSEVALSLFTIIDANNDGRTFTYYDGAVRCQYNSSMAMDDWMITPPLKLEAGKVYKLTFDAWANSSSFPETFAVYMGQGNTIAAMTTELVAETTITDAKAAPYKGAAYITAAADGNYNIGFHGCSAADEFYLTFDNIAVSAPVDPDAPAVATDLAAVADANGANSATVSFKAPAVNIGNQPLTEALTKVEVLRGEEVVKTFEAPAAGAELSFVDEVPAAGDYTWTVVAYNAKGQSDPVSVSCYVGFQAPAAPANVQIVETETPGTIKVTWDAVSQDIAGLNIPADRITYQLCIVDGNYWVPQPATATSATEMTYVYQAADAPQDFAQVGIVAYIDGETSGSVGASDLIPVGPAYQGLNESFNDGTLSYIFGTNSAGGGQWSIKTDESFTDMPDADGTNGYAAMRGQSLDASAELFTGYVTLEGMVNPGLSFYTYNLKGEPDETTGEIPADINIIEVQVKEKGAANWDVVLNTTVAEICGEDEGWSKANVSLEAYKGKTIQVKFIASTQWYVYTFLDAVRVKDMLAQDLVAAKIQAPKTVVPVEEYTVDVDVFNDGADAASAFTVELYANDQLVETKNVDGLAPNMTTVQMFALTMPALAEEPIEYYAKVVYAADENQENNTSDKVTVAPKLSNLPKVEDLAAEGVADGVKLSWSEPNLDVTLSQTVTETFDDVEPWTGVPEGWTFIDVDGAPIGGMQNLDIPEHPLQSLASFWVFSTELVAGSTTAASFEAHSGNQYAVAMFRYDDGQTDDWMVSPTLTGEAQTISFYAKSYSASYPETIAVYYSTGSEDPADFTVVETCRDQVVPAEWTLYTVELPAGAVRFAIRSYASGSFMLMVDDVTFEMGDPNANLELVGYNVYRNGELIAEKVAETEYIDAQGNNGDEYQVVVVYDRGLSAPSNKVSAAQVGLTEAFAGVSVRTAPQTILVKGAKGQVVVASVDGKVLYNGFGDATVTVLPGVYVVKADNKVYKLRVK